MPENCPSCNISSDAVLKWCIECKQAVCQTCTVDHRYNKMTIDHKVVEARPSLEVKQVHYSKQEEYLIEGDEYEEICCMTRLPNRSFLLGTGQKLRMFNPSDKSSEKIFELTDLKRIIPIVGTDEVLVSHGWPEKTQFLNYKTQTAGKWLPVEAKLEACNLINNKIVTINTIEYKLRAYTYTPMCLLEKEQKMDVKLGEEDVIKLLQGPNNTILLLTTENLFCFDKDWNELWFYQASVTNEEYYEVLADCLVDDSGCIFLQKLYKKSSEIVDYNLIQLTPNGMILAENSADKPTKTPRYLSMCFNNDCSELCVAETEPMKISVYKRQC